MIGGVAQLLKILLGRIDLDLVAEIDHGSADDGFEPLVAAKIHRDGGEIHESIQNE